MRTTVTIDNELMAKAVALSGINERSALLREGLKALIERESTRRLAQLGGSEQNLEDAPRRRSAVD